MRHAVAGDHDALSALLREHGPAVESALRINRKWRSVLEPSDVMQVTYLEAFLHIHDFDLQRPDAFRAWLEQIARRNLADAVRGLSCRKRPDPARRSTCPGGTDAIEFLDVLAASVSGPSRRIQREEIQDALERALAQIPADYASAVRLLDLQGLSPAEAARLMGRSPGAVHMLRARAHDRLRELLGRESQFFTSGA